MNSKRRLSQNLSATKLRFDSALNKILKVDSHKSRKHKQRETIAKQVSRVALSELLKNTPTKAYQNLPDFKTFLANKENIRIFREFLKTQYCQENIDFYLACEKYRSLDPEKVGNDLVKFMATQIFNDYLGENARQPVNINHDCLQTIIEQMREPHPNLLSDAQMEIFNLMRTDCYPRFCKTWLLDRETATKILCERHMESTTLNRINTATTGRSGNNIDTSGLTTSSIGVDSTPSSSTRSLQLRGTMRELAPQSNLECTPSCPYYRVGLPCQQHIFKEKPQRGASDLIDQIKLSRIHHVPNCRPPKRSPPPPPLPSKPYEIVSSVSNKKSRPYVGEAFDV